LKRTQPMMIWLKRIFLKLTKGEMIHHNKEKIWQ
jgi:hypothetical protein